MNSTLVMVCDMCWHNFEVNKTRAHNKLLLELQKPVNVKSCKRITSLMQVNNSKYFKTNGDVV